MKTFKNRNGGDNDNGCNNGNNNNDNDSVSATRADMREDMITLGEAMISGIRTASIDNEAGTVVTQTTQETSNSGGSRPFGDLGSIGNIFRNHNKCRHNN